MLFPCCKCVTNKYIYKKIIFQSYGVDVERIPSSQMQSTVDEYCAKHNMMFCHSFDDHRVIAGHAR